jgi:hypothetical protein
LKEDDDECDSAIKRLIAMRGNEWVLIIFYGDESGTHGKGDYFISGYLAHKTTWDAFRNAWNKALKADSPKPIKYLKMSEWQHREGEFCGWSDDEANRKLEHMLFVLSVFLKNGHICEHSCVISWEMYNRCTTGAFREIFDNPYYLNFKQVVMRACQRAVLVDPDFAGKIDFVLDEGNSAERGTPGHYIYVKAFAEPEVSKCMGSLTFANDKDEPGLQAADMLAWHSRRSNSGLDPASDIRHEHFAFIQEAASHHMRERYLEDGLIEFNDRVNLLIDNLLAATGGRMLTEDDKGYSEFEKFNSAMDKILKANPTYVREAIEAGKKANTVERKARGERKRGRKAKTKKDGQSGK